MTSAQRAYSGWTAAFLIAVFSWLGARPLAAQPAVEAAPAAAPAGGGIEEAAGEGAYVLGPGDEIFVRVAPSEDFNDEPTRIGGDGHVGLPLIGRVVAAGRTPAELERELGLKLERFIRSPQVAVSVAEYRSQPVSVIGAVNDPGVRQTEGRKTLVEMLSTAGGLREDAGNMVKITRRPEWGPIPLPGAAPAPGGKGYVAEVRLEDVMEQNVLVRPHDVISVPRANLVYVVGAVGEPGGFPLHEREAVSVLQALALAGGLEKHASAKKAKILRPVGEGKDRAEIAVNLKKVMAGKALDQPLGPEDILFVPESGGKTMLLRAADSSIRIATGIAVWTLGR